MTSRAVITGPGVRRTWLQKTLLGGVVAGVLAAAVSLAWVEVAPAHGVDLSWNREEGVRVVARYDSGEPMSGAQVAVYSPDEPSEPWTTGYCDDSGEFFFVPDHQIPGTWEVQVRQAGHGGMLMVDVETGSASVGGSTGFTALQKGMMAVAVAWGFAGTALYFLGRKRQDAHS